MLTSKAAVSEALRDQLPRVTLENIKKWLSASRGSTLKINGTTYKVIELYDFHLLAADTQYGIRESFTYGELWMLYAQKKRR